MLSSASVDSKAEYLRRGDKNNPITSEHNKLLRAPIPEVDSKSQAFEFESFGRKMNLLYDSTSLDSNYFQFLPNSAFDVSKYKSTGTGRLPHPARQPFAPFFQVITT